MCNVKEWKNLALRYSLNNPQEKFSMLFIVNEYLQLYI